MQVLETAVKYQMYHALALMGISILYQQFPGKMLQWAGNLFIAGTFLFSGSLYMLCFVKHLNLQHFLWIGAITPLGGICFITGWLMIAFAAAKK